MHDYFLSLEIDDIDGSYIKSSIVDKRFTPDRQVHSGRRINPAVLYSAEAQHQFLAKMTAEADIQSAILFLLGKHVTDPPICLVGKGYYP